MQHINVICANPPLFNPGMHSVDMAFRRFSERHRLASDIRFYCVPDVDPTVMMLMELPFEYRNTYEHLNHFQSGDAIVFWGDFLHNRHYLLTELVPRLSKTWPSRTNPELLELAYKVSLLEDIDLSASRIIVFGGNIAVNDSLSLNDSRWVNGLTRLYGAASLVLTRDVISAMAVNNLMQDYETNYCGVDCAFLLSDGKAAAHYQANLSRHGQGHRIGVFLGRSWYNEPCLQLCEKVCKTLGTKGAWIPWFHDKPWPLLEKYRETFDITAPNAGFWGTIAQLQDYSVVISDTYHLCINAWSRGIPAVCIGRGVGPAEYSTDDKKKETLYNMIGASDLYVYSEALLPEHLDLEVVLSLHNEADIVDSLCEALATTPQIERIFERIDAARACAERRLFEALVG